MKKIIIFLASSFLVEDRCHSSRDSKAKQSRLLQVLLISGKLPVCETCNNLIFVLWSSFTPMLRLWWSCVWKWHSTNNLEILLCWFILPRLLLKQYSMNLDSEPSDWYRNVWIKSNPLLKKRGRDVVFFFFLIYSRWSFFYCVLSDTRAWSVKSLEIYGALLGIAL